MHRRIVFLLACLLVLLSALGAGNDCGAANYTITDLGTLGGESSGAYAINNQGDVVGSSRLVGDHDFHAFLYHNGVMSDLGTLGGSFSQAYAIADTGQIVGEATLDTDLYHAFSYQGGAMTDLGVLFPYLSEAWAVNSHGQIAGWTSTAPSGFDHAFLIDGAGMIDLGTFGGFSSRANDINESGTVVGWASLADNTQHAFVYSGGVMTDLGAALGENNNSYATSINDSGQIIGSGLFDEDTHGSHAFLFSGGVYTDLGTLGGKFSFAGAINAGGQIVGSSTLTLDDRDSTHGFLYQNGAMHDLNTLIDPAEGWNLIYASSINDRGQIVGYGLHGDLGRAYLLTPVPEPGGIVLAVLGLGFLVWARVRRIGRRSRQGV